MARNVGPVQVALAGLYGLLGVKDGSNPDVVTGFVQPTLDAMPWWLRATREQLVPFSQHVATGGIDTILIATVPNNEWWYIEQATAYSSWDVATIQAGYMVSWQVVEAVINTVMYLTPNDPPLAVDAAGNVFNMIGPTLARGLARLEHLWVPPGARIYVQWVGNIALPDNLNVTMYGCRARI